MGNENGTSVSVRRMALLGEDAGAPKTIEALGQKYLIRKPSLPCWMKFLKVAGKAAAEGVDLNKLDVMALASLGDIGNDLLEVLVEVVIGCTYDPETGARIFGPDDREELLNSHEPMEMIRLASAALELVQEAKAVAGEDSAETSASG